MNLLKHLFTERDNSTFCIVRTMLSAGGAVMIGKFAMHGGDYQAFGLGLAAIGAAVAAKNASEK